MSRGKSLFASKSIGLISIAACVLVVLALALTLMLSTIASFRTGINGAVRTQTRELSTQIVYNYESYIERIINTSTKIQIEMDGVKSDDDWQSLSDYFGLIMRLNDDIIKIAVYDQMQACLASSDADEIGTFVEGDDLNWFSEAMKDPTVHVFSIPYSEGSGNVYKVNVSKSCVNLPDGSSGVLKIEISFTNFIELVRKSNLGEGGHITIIDTDYEIVYTSLPDQNLAKNELPVVRDMVLGTQNATLNGYNMAINVDTLSNTKWRICVFINIDRLTDIERIFLSTIIILSCAALGAGVLVFAGVARIITVPMKHLELAMRKVEKSDYFQMEEVKITAFKEVNALSGRFNRMMRKIDELMRRVVAEQNAQRKSELKALQNQINPHFLYNTLDSIIWLIENGKNPEASEMVIALAKLFRIGISNDSETIPLRDEIEHVRNYLLIQSIRYSDSFDYTFDVDENVLNAKTMKLILQPIVENCLYHGLRHNIDPGIIKISARIENDYLVLSVADNGYGMRQETIDALYESFNDGSLSSGVGLKNIYQRVMIYYGGDAEMNIESVLDQGTTITIKEPFNNHD